MSSLAAAMERQLSTVDENPTLTVRGTVGQPSISCLLNRDLHVLATLQATENAEALGSRRPLELSLVIDKSGSMSGEKIHLVRQTLELLEKQLGSNDSVSLITFYTEVHTSFPMRKLNSPDARDKFIRCVKNIQPGTSTNLSGGLSEGICELKKSTQRNVIRAVLLLTDGHANHGITDMKALARMTTTAVEGTGIKVFTYGYGKDHDANALQALSDATDGGSFYFVEKIDTVGSALGDALGGLLSVCAQNIRLRAEVVPGTRIVKVQAPGRDYKEVVPGGIYELKFGDLYAGERRDVMFQIDVDPARAPRLDCPLIQFQVQYVDAIQEKMSVCEAVATVSRVDDGMESTTLDPAVVDHICRMHVSENMLEANKLADAHKYPEARKLIATALKFCEDHMAIAKTKSLIQELVTDCKQALQAMSNRQQWTSSGGGHSMKSKMQSHCYQRCNSSAVSTFSSYRTPSKQAAAMAMSPAQAMTPSRTRLPKPPMTPAQAMTPSRTRLPKPPKPGGY